jgi:23S rRNA pseudouridine1911/1915/1917 synthase
MPRMKGLAKLFAAHDIERRYLAVRRRPALPHPQADHIRTQIGRSTTDRKKMAGLPEVQRQARRHPLPYDRAAARRGNRWSNAVWKTGRTHQVRVHYGAYRPPIGRRFHLQ